MYVRIAGVLAVILLFTVTSFAQVKLAVVDFERAVFGTAEGKKAEAKLSARLAEVRGEFEKKQKELEEKQNQLKTQDRVLSDTARTELTRDITRRTTELTRMQEDGQKELDSLRQESLGPVIELARRVLNALASERGYDTLIDTSAPNNNVLFADKRIDITDELIKQIDALQPAQPAQTPKPAPAAPPATPPGPTNTKPQ